MKKDGCVNFYIGLLAISFVLITMVQGGFFPKIYISASILITISMAIALHTTDREKRNQIFNKNSRIHFVILACFILCYLISAICYGCCKNMLLRFIYVFVLLEISIISRILPDEIRIWMYKIIVLCGYSSVAIGFLPYLDVPVANILVNFRLMGVFQYANTYAVFLGMILILQEKYFNGSKELQVARPLVVVAMLLTMSVGGVGSYILVHLLYKDKNRIFELIYGAFFAGLVYIVKILNWFSGFVLVILFLALLIPILTKKRRDWEKWENVSIFLVGVAEIICAGLLVGHRALGTCYERLQQMRDGSIIISKNFLYGIGAGNLSYYLNQMQADYKVNIIHNSYVQIGVEAGIIACILFILLILNILFEGKRCKEKFVQKISIMAAIHFLIDIDFYFAGFLWVWLFVTSSNLKKI